MLQCKNVLAAPEASISAPPARPGAVRAADKNNEGTGAPVTTRGMQGRGRHCPPVRARDDKSAKGVRVRRH